MSRTLVRTGTYDGFQDWKTIAIFSTLDALDKEKGVLQICWYQSQ